MWVSSMPMMNHPSEMRFRISLIQGHKLTREYSRLKCKNDRMLGGKNVFLMYFLLFFLFHCCNTALPVVKDVQKHFRGIIFLETVLSLVGTVAYSSKYFLIKV